MVPQTGPSAKLLIIYVLMVAYVVFMANLIIKEPPEASPVSIEAAAAVEQVVNTSADPCNSFELYACGHYTEFNALSPWATTKIIGNRHIEHIVDECEAIVKNWNMPISNDTSTLLLWGYEVNNISFDITWENKVVKLIVSASDNTTHTTDPTEFACISNLLPEHVNQKDVIIRGLPCDFVCDDNETALTAVPADYPTTCLQLTSAMQINRVTSAMPVPNISDIVDPIIRAYGLNTSFHLGGGPSVIGDIDFEENVSSMWIRQREAAFKVVGNPLTGPTWAMGANVVNMWYDGDQDAVFVPSGMFFPPMYHADYDMDVKLGTIGFFISHEFGHALDKRLKNTTLGNMLVRRIETVANTTERVNITAKEDIADYYGIQYLEKAHGPLSKLTLLKLAQAFCMESEEFSGDVHAPGRWRVNTTMSFSTSYRREWCL